MRLHKLAGLTFLAAMLTQAGTITTFNDPTGSRASFPGNDAINWDSAGAELDTLSNPFTVLSTNGISVDVSQPSGQFIRLNQGSSWGGNFTGDGVLLYNEAGGTVTLTFATPVMGVGFQISPNFSDTAAEFQVFGAGDVSFGTFPLTVTDRTTDSASFIGVQSSLTDITKIVIGLGPGQDFAMNQVSLIDGDTSSVPEPTTFSLVGLAGIAAMVIRRRA